MPMTSPHRQAEDRIKRTASHRQAKDGMRRTSFHRQAEDGIRGLLPTSRLIMGLGGFFPQEG